MARLRMTYDGLLAAADAHAEDPAVRGFVDLLRAWKTDDRDVRELELSVERYFGNSWIADKAVHKALYRQWAQFRTTVIDSIGGLTMNERLYWFGLFDRYDRADDAARKRLYAKLLAHR